MRPAEHFRYCPRCGVIRADMSPTTPMRCTNCKLTYYFNPTVTAAAFVFDDRDRVLFIRRAKDPAAGMLGVPGGFIDIGETAEEGLRREVREEVGLEIDGVQYLGSCTNEYYYQEVTYPVVDLIFSARAIRPELALPLDAVAGLEWRKVQDVQQEELAFPSLKMGLQILQHHR